MESLRELGLEHIPLIGLAKRLEEIVIPGQRDTMLLPKTSSSLRLLQHIRDEAHRFAIEFHRSLRQRRTLQTELANIPGVGPKTIQKIFEKFGSVRGVQAATLDDLQDVLGPSTGRSVYQYFSDRREAAPATDEIASSELLPVLNSAAADPGEDLDDVQLLEDEDGEGEDDERGDG